MSDQDPEQGGVDGASEGAMAHAHAALANQWSTSVE